MERIWGFMMTPNMLWNGEKSHSVSLFSSLVTLVDTGVYWFTIRTAQKEPLFAMNLLKSLTCC